MRIPVSSSNLRSVGYNPMTSTLEVEFHTGSVYEYDRVPGHVHVGLMGASSKGEYFHDNIRDRYPTRRLA